MIIWCVINYKLRINIISCYLRLCIYRSWIWSIASNFWSLNFIKLASCPVTVRNNLLSYYIVSTSSSQFSLLTQINTLTWFISSNGTLDSLTEITFLVVIWNIILINSLSVVSYVNCDWSMTICAKGNSCWNFWISNMPVSWNIILNISWDIALVSNTS